MIITILLLMVTGAYIYAIKGEKLNENDKSWITEIPAAHRGLNNSDIPENSMAAFKNAIENGYEIELDVQLTYDELCI